MLTVSFVSRQKMTALNKQYCHKNYSTDVLAFDWLGHKLPSKRPAGILKADIIVSVDAARKNARFYHMKFESELILYVIHGILHCLGYDDHSQQDVRMMRAREKELMAFVQNDSPGIFTG